MIQQPDIINNNDSEFLRWLYRAKKKTFSFLSFSSNFPHGPDWIQMANFQQLQRVKNLKGHLSGRCEEEEIDHSRGLRRFRDCAWGDVFGPGCVSLT